MPQKNNLIYGSLPTHSLWGVTQNNQNPTAFFRLDTGVVCFGYFYFRYIRRPAREDGVLYKVRIET